MNHLFNPLVSIIIPVYNGSMYLEKAINSAIEQSYKNIEIIVVNDGSNDQNKTENIAKLFSDKIKYYYKHNNGVASALNYGIEKSHGDYISWLSHDDYYKKDKIKTQIDYYNLIDDKNKVLFSALTIVNKNETVINDFYIKDKWLKHVLLTIISTSLNGCTTLVPKSAFVRAGLFDENLKTVQDNDLWLRMALDGIQFAYIPESLLYSRKHLGQTSVTMKDIHRLEKIKFYYQFIKKNKEFTILNYNAIREILVDKQLYDLVDLLDSTIKHNIKQS